MAKIEPQVSAWSIQQKILGIMSLKVETEGKCKNYKSVIRQTLHQADVFLMQR